MIKQICYLILFCTGTLTLQAQKFPVDTLLYHGDPGKYINFVFLGDGFTATEQDKFISEARNVLEYFFKQEPWSHYKNYFNAFAVKVISKESGAIHPHTASDCDKANVPISNPDNYFMSSFDVSGIHRLVVPRKLPDVVKVLAANMPQYDQAIIIVNSPYYGGSGGDFATLTTDKNSADVAAHEIGHSFAQLSDEYWAGDVYAGERVNMTKESDPNKVKWKNWIGVNEVGVYKYCCGGQSEFWNRPHLRCKMGQLNAPFCKVCSEAIVEKIHKLTNPIVDFTPSNLKMDATSQPVTFRLSALMQPEPNTLHITWELDAQEISGNNDQVTINFDTLSPGLYDLTATVVDTTDIVRVDDHQWLHFNTVSWTINKMKSSGTVVTASVNKIAYTVYPNPVSDALTVTIEGQQPVKNLSVGVFSSDGRQVHNIAKDVDVADTLQLTSDISHLPAGNYYIVFRTKSTVKSLSIHKL